MKIIAYAAWDQDFELCKFDTEAEAVEFCGDPDRVIPIIDTEELQDSLNEDNRFIDSYEDYR
jgi:hypothetical protein